MSFEVKKHFFVSSVSELDSPASKGEETKEFCFTTFSEWQYYDDNSYHSGKRYCQALLVNCFISGCFNRNKYLGTLQRYSVSVFGHNCCRQSIYRG